MTSTVRLLMCPLPPGLWWEVRLIMRLDSVHISLRKKWRGSELDSACVVLDFSRAPMDVAVQKIIDGSYELWGKHNQVVYGKDKEWESRAQELKDRLVATDTPVKIKLEKP
jgi:hypothetical protein